MTRHLLLPLLLLTAFAARATGYEVWNFGMTRDEVSQQTLYGPYYSFENGDLGSEAGPYEGNRALISFYFDADHLVRVMLITYMGDDIALARAAWSKVYEHLHRVSGQVEVPDNAEGPAALEIALATFDRNVPNLAAGKRIQMGAFPMQSDRRVWASVTRLPNQQLMISVNYGAR